MKGHSKGVEYCAIIINRALWMIIPRARYHVSWWFCTYDVFNAYQLPGIITVIAVWLFKIVTQWPSIVYSKIWSDEMGCSGVDEWSGCFHFLATVIGWRSWFNERSSSVCAHSECLKENLAMKGDSRPGTRPVDYSTVRTTLRVINLTAQEAELTKGGSIYLFTR